MILRDCSLPNFLSPSPFFSSPHLCLLHSPFPTPTSPGGPQPLSHVSTLVDVFLMCSTHVPGRRVAPPQNITAMCRGVCGQLRSGGGREGTRELFWGPAMQADAQAQVWGQSCLLLISALDSFFFVLLSYSAYNIRHCYCPLIGEN